jgi:hypothetical protein
MHRLRIISGCLVLAFAGALSAFAQPPEVIGRIEGEAFSARGQVSVAQEGGRSVTTLLSGSEVTVRGGQARLLLADGGEIDICGPAQFSLLKSGGALTVALNYGRVHMRVAAELPLQVYSALVTAVPLSVGGKPRDAVIGLDAAGDMCVFAAHGAVRLEHQFSGQRVLVPQLSEVSLPGGQLESLQAATGGCRCEVPVARKDVPAPLETAPVRARAEEPSPEPAKEPTGPVYTAIMPPLTFSAEAPAPPPLHPAPIQLLREVRLRPAVFSGRVERPAPAAKAPQPAASTAGITQSVEAKPGIGTRIKNFFRRLFGRKTTP